MNDFRVISTRNYFHKVNINTRETNLSPQMAEKRKLTFIDALSYLFYVTKIFGLIPYSLTKYRQHKILVNSVSGNILSLLSLVLYVFLYHDIVSQTYFDGKGFDSGKEVYYLLTRTAVVEYRKRSMD